MIDVAGNLRLTQTSIESYRKGNPKLVDKIRFTQAPAPELPSKIKAQQDAGRLDIDLLLTGLDGLAAGIEQDLWLRLMPDYQDKFPGLETNYLPAARKMDELAKGFAITVTFYPSGPLLEYAPGGENSTDDLLHGAKRIRKIYVCSTSQFRSRTNLIDGVALPPWTVIQRILSMVGPRPGLI